jgi:hypothetical protein
MELEQALGESGGQEAGKGAEFVAAKLTEALQVRYARDSAYKPLYIYIISRGSDDLGAAAGGSRSGFAACSG